MDYLYENELFFVDVELETGDVIERDGATYTDYYIVVNRESGIVEFKTTSIVEAITGAAMAYSTMKGEPWKFYERGGDGSLGDDDLEAMFPKSDDEPVLN